MAQAPSTATPSPTAAEPATGSAPAPAAPTAQPTVTGGDAADAVYEQAFARYLDDKATPPAQPAATPQAPAAAPDTPAVEGDAQDDGAGDADDLADPLADEAPQEPGPDLSDEQLQLLRRSHLSPEMIASWSPEQRSAFLENAAKREADQTRSYKGLQDRLKALESQIASAGQGTGNPAATQPAGGGASQPAAQAAPAITSLAEEATKVVDELAGVYGDEIKPLGRIIGVMDQQITAARQEAAAMPVLQDLLAEMTVDLALRDLVTEFPSLGSASTRQKVVERFHRDWQSSPHASAEGSILSRIRSAVGDAARSEFGTVTESAASVALANKTKDRLKQQPKVGAGRGRKAAPTEDDVYDQAYEQFVKPELARG